MSPYKALVFSATRESFVGRTVIAGTEVPVSRLPPALRTCHVDRQTSRRSLLIEARFSQRNCYNHAEKFPRW